MKLQESAEKVMERYSETFAEQFEALESSPLAKIRKLDTNDFISLGNRLKRFNDMVEHLNEEDGNLNKLGALPKVALDIIVANHGTSPLGVLADIQQLPEEVGLVHFWNTRAKSARGDVDAGQLLQGAKEQGSTPLGYAAGGTLGMEIAAGDGTETDWTIELGKQIRSQSLKVYLEDRSARGEAQVDGSIYGYGLQGTIDHKTGELVVEFTEAPANDAKILVDFVENFETAENLPEVETYLDHMTIEGEPFVLKNTAGMFQNFALKNRGIDLQSMIKTNLVSELNKEISGKCIRAGYVQAGSIPDFDLRTANLRDGVSYDEHVRHLKIHFAKAESNMNSTVGRGVVNVIIAGYKAAESFNGMPGFSKLFDGRTTGAHLYGTLDGVPVVRVNHTNIIPADEIMFSYKGGSLDSAIVYGEYMPVTTTDFLPTGANVLTSQTAAAAFGGVKTVVPGFISKMKVQMD